MLSLNFLRTFAIEALLVQSVKVVAGGGSGRAKVALTFAILLLLLLVVEVEVLID